MTTETYIVAYPHPEVPLRRRILPLRLDSDSSGNTVFKRLCDGYPDHHNDLENATLWKASRSTFNSGPTSTLTNITDFWGSPLVVYNKSKAPVYKWIKEREKYSKIKLYMVLERCFPDGPQQPSGDWVDIMVVTTESTRRCAYLSRFI